MKGSIKLIFILFFAGFVVGAGTTLLSQYIDKHVNISITYDHQHDFH